MTYIPTPVILPTPSPSPRARMLAEKLKATVEEFRRYEPETTAEDIRFALQLAGPRRGGNRAALAVSVLIGLMALLVLAFLFLYGGGQSLPRIPLVGVVIAVLGVLAVVFAMARR